MQLLLWKIIKIGSYIGVVCCHSTAFSIRPIFFKSHLKVKKNIKIYFQKIAGYIFKKYTKGFSKNIQKGFQKMAGHFYK
jgi:hypothetical protein